MNVKGNGNLITNEKRFTLPCIQYCTLQGNPRILAPTEENFAKAAKQIEKTNVQTGF